MLQPGERIDNHDKMCCEYYASLLALGAYDEEFALFGTTYIEDGRKKCFISPNRERIYDFFVECREKQIYPSVVESKIKRCRVNSGEKELTEQQLKLEFAKELDEKYSKEFLMQLQKIALCPINNKGAEILNPLRDSLEGCFDEDALQLYENAVEFAYDGKILTSMDYFENKNWLALERDFLAEKMRPSSNLKRLMSGFGYLKNGTIKYYTNALKEKTDERRMELMSEGVITTPVFVKEYFLNGYHELSKCLKDFDRLIAEKIDANYVELITDLYEIKPNIESKEISELEESLSMQEKSKQKTCQYYSILWHLHSM